MILLSTEFLNSSSLWNDLLAIVGIIVGVISVLVTVISIIGTLVTLRKSRPIYTKQEIKLNKADHDGTEPTVITRIAIWNTGKTLLSSDVIKKAPICIKIDHEQYKIIGFTLLYSEEKNDIKNLKISDDGSTITFDFDLLRNNEGFVLDVLHTVHLYEDKETIDGLLKAEGSLIEGGDVLFISPVPRNLGIIFFVSNIFLTLYFVLFMIASYRIIQNYTVIAIMMFILTFAAAIQSMTTLVKSRFISRIIPKKLNKILFNS